jgi:hypothetical protein
MPTPRKIDPHGRQGGIVIVNFRATIDTLATLKKISRSKGITVSDYLRGLVINAIENEGGFVSPDEMEEYL